MWPSLLAAILVGSGSAPASPPSRIVVTSDRTGLQQLYSVEPSGHGLAQLTFGTGRGLPVASPDGRFVAAIDPSGLWVMRADGSGARRVARGETRSVF